MAICEAKELCRLGSWRVMWAGREIPVNNSLVRERPRFFGNDVLTVSTTAPDKVRYSYASLCIGLDHPGMVGEEINEDPFLRDVVHFVPSLRLLFRRLFIVEI